jgi:hypothetical protein
VTIRITVVTNRITVVTNGITVVTNGITVGATERSVLASLPTRRVEAFVPLHGQMLAPMDVV